MKKETSHEEDKYRQFSRYASSRPYNDIGPLRPRHTARTILILTVLAVLIAVCCVGRGEISDFLSGRERDPGKLYESFRGHVASQLFGETEYVSGIPGGAEGGSYAGTEAETETETEPETEVPFSPHAVESTQPSRLIASTGI